MILQPRSLGEAAPVTQGRGYPALVIMDVLKVIRMMLEAGQTSCGRVTVTYLGLSVCISPEKEEDHHEDQEEQRHRGYRPKANLQQQQNFKIFFNFSRIYVIIDFTLG